LHRCLENSALPTITFRTTQLVILCVFVRTVIAILVLSIMPSPADSVGQGIMFLGSPISPFVRLVSYCYHDIS